MIWLRLGDMCLDDITYLDQAARSTMKRGVDNGKKEYNEAEQEKSRYSIDFPILVML
jgi:hypothetical protein